MEARIDGAQDDDPIDQLLAECLDQPQAQWEENITAVCAANPETAAEVRRRFARLVRLGIVDAPLPTPQTPDRLGDYRLIRRLGSGTMGVVWLAVDERLGRQVALKILRREHLYFEDARHRFRREMEAAARLDHSALCSIFEAGEHDGVPFLAMRYVAGRSLADWLVEQREARRTRGGSTGLDAARRDQVCDWVQILALALHEAHDAGFVHRDVKPANIVLDKDHQPVLLDFGLAHALDAEHGAQLTATGAQLGTPAYMAPEQVRGEPVDRRTDVWALGVLLYECLTLRLPFESGTREALFREILASDPPRVHRVERSVPEDLALVVATAIAKNPAERYATARAFADDLQRVRRHERIAARQPPLWLQARRWTQRHPVATAVVALLGLALAITLGFVLVLERNLRHTRALVLAAEVRKTLAEDPTLSLLLAREGLVMDECLETRSAAFAALARSRCDEFWEFDEPPRQAAWLAGDPPGMVVHTDAGLLWRRGGGEWRTLFARERRADERLAMTVVAAGEVVVFKSGNRLHAWRWTGAAEPVPVDLGLDGVQRFESDPNLPFVLGLWQGKDAVLVDVLSGRRWDDLRLRRDQVRRAAFAPDGSRVAVVDAPRRQGLTEAGEPMSVRIHRLDGSGLVESRDHATGVDAIAFAADGRLLTGAADGRLRMFEADGSEFAFPPHEAPGIRIRTSRASTSRRISATSPTVCRSRPSGRERCRPACSCWTRWAPRSGTCRSTATKTAAPTPRRSSTVAAASRSATTAARSACSIGPRAAR